VLLVDKPRGPTSHDVVAAVRRRLHVKRVGHAGTLDPMATGLLVVLLGQGTKLAPYLSADDKQYVARVRLGASTSTLDSEGTVDAEAPVGDDLRAALDTVRRGAGLSPLLARALETERARAEQVPPAFSAIKVDGRRSYADARRGQAPRLDPRPVRVLALDAIGADPEDDRPTLELSLRVSKGYYVRSLARDLGAALGVPAHLDALRRTASGPFLVDESIDPAEPELGARILPVVDAIRRALPSVVLTPEGAARAAVGKRLGREHFTDAPPTEGPLAWLDPAGALVAIGRRREDDEHAVDRGFGEDT
jgi:tRNA pseudouridine55 synthase